MFSKHLSSLLPIQMKPSSVARLSLSHKLYKPTLGIVHSCTDPYERLIFIFLTTGCLLMIAFYFLHLRNYFNVTIIFVLLFPRKNTKPFHPPPLARFLLPYGQLCIFCLLLQAQFCQAQLQFFNFNFKLEAEIALISIYHIQLLPF